MSANGRLAASELETVDGWAELVPTAVRAYLAAATFILTHYGVRPQITRPYGAYRDLAMQRLVKAIYGKLAATPGYSNHGLGIAFDMNNVMAVARAVGGIAVLDGIMARFGFNRNASNGSGGIEEWHYALVAVVDLAGVAGMDHTQITSLGQETDTTMKFFYLDNDGNGKPCWVTVNTVTGKTGPITYDQKVANGWSTFWGNAQPITRQELLNGLQIIQATK